MKEFTKHYKGVNAISDCLRDLEKIADVCGLIGGNTYPLSDLVIDTPNIINSYYNLKHDGETSYFYLYFRKSGCVGSDELNDFKNRYDGLSKALFLVKLTMKYRVVKWRYITMEVKAEI